MRTSKVRGPSPSKRKNASDTPTDAQQRLTLTMTEQDLAALQKISDANIRSMSAQALFYIRVGIQRELKELEITD